MSIRPRSSSNATQQQQRHVFRLLPKQADFVACAARYPALVGGIGSGKSRAGAVKALAYMTEHPGSMGAIVAPTYPMLRDATLRTVLEMAPEGFVASFHKQEMLLRAANGAEVIFRSADVPSRLRGPNLSWVWVDEAGYVTDEAWDILKGRIRSERFPNQAWVTSTPKGRGNFLWREWEQQPTAGHVLFRASSLENWHLPTDFVRGLGYAGAFYRQEVLGEFTAFEGLVYPGFTRAHVQPAPGPDQEWRRVACGVDWGFRDPACLLVVADRGDHCYHVLEEWYARSVTIEEQITAARDLHQRHSIDHFCCDPSRPDSIELMRRSGLPVLGADNDILTGVSAITTLLGPRDDGQAGLLVAPECVNLIAEMESYQWPDPKPERNAGEKPLDFNNHCLVAGTLIDTDRGPLPIEAVRRGMRVLTRRGYRRVTAAGLTQLAAPTVTATFSGGATLTGTGDHPVWTTNHGWVRLDALRYADILEAVQPYRRASQAQWLTRTSTERASASSTTGRYSAATRNRPSERWPSISPRSVAGACTAPFGRRTTARSRPAGTSITATAILSTTTRPILHASPGQSTSAFMPARPSSASARGNTSTRYAPLRPRGMALHRVEHGTASMAKRRLRVVRHCRGHVSSAAVTSQVWLGAQTTVSARVPANRRGGEQRALTMCSDSVQRVARPLRRTNTPRHAAVRGHVLGVCATGRCEPVYDLTVEDAHEFYANGVLVHNCVDSLRYACMWLEHGGQLGPLSGDLAEVLSGYRGL